MSRASLALWVRDVIDLVIEYSKFSIFLPNVSALNLSHARFDLCFAGKLGRNLATQPVFGVGVGETFSRRANSFRRTSASRPNYHGNFARFSQRHRYATSQKLAEFVAARATS